MIPGVDGTGETVTVTVRGELLPHALTATTEMLPPAAPATTVILFVVDVPVHPEGNVQMYEVAPLTDPTE